MSEPLDPSDPPPFAPYECERSEQLYDSVWCGLRRDHLVLEDGRRQDYHVFEVTDAAVCVPVLSDGSIVLIWQHRHPHGRTHWEVPAGRIATGEPPLEAAAREVLEETGFRPGRMEPLPGFYPINGISAHYAHAYRALECEHVGDPTLDASERLVVRVWPEERVRRWLLEGRFEDGFTALALSYHFLTR